MITTGVWSCLISFARTPPTSKEGKQAKNSKGKYMSPPGIESTTLCFQAGHLICSAIEPVDYLCFQHLQYSEVTGNAWVVSKDMAVQFIKLIMVIYVLKQTFRPICILPKM